MRNDASAGLPMATGPRAHAERMPAMTYANRIKFNCSEYLAIMSHPANCYNCAMRDGFPFNLGGDDCCKNFKRVSPKPAQAGRQGAGAGVSPEKAISGTDRLRGREGASTGVEAGVTS